MEYVRHDDYDARNQVTEEKVTTLIGSDTYYTDTVFDYQAASGAGQYNGAYQGGIVTHSRATTTKNGTGATTTDTVNSFLWWEGADQSQIDYTSSGATTHSYYHYDALGHIGSVNIDDGRRRDVSFVTDGSGTVLQRDEQDYNTNGTVNTTTGDPRELYFYFAGTRVGDVSNNGTSDTDYVVSLGAHLSQGTGGFRGGATTGVAYADFDQAYEPINGLNYDATSSRYTVQSGDTLQSIAQTVWGDSSLWYMIADANGLDGSETLAAGRDLIIPNKVHNVHNTSDVYRVYDPNDTIGNTSPSTPKPSSNGHHGCGVFGQILLIAIAVAVTLVIKAPITSFFQGALGAGTAVTTGGFVAAETAGAVIGGAVTGAIASTASQLVGVATGIQDKFSWTSVALSAVSAGAANGVSELGELANAGFVGGTLGVIGKALGGAGTLSTALRGIAIDALTQGVAVATGLQSSFDWAGVATAGVGAAVGNLAGGGQFGGIADGLASAAARSLITGTDFGDNIMRALPSIIGNTVGGYVAKQLSDRDEFDPTNPRFAGKSPDEIADALYQAAARRSGDPALFTRVTAGDANVKAALLDQASLIAAARDAGVSIDDAAGLIGLPVGGGAGAGSAGGVMGDIEVDGRRTFGDVAAHSLISAEAAIDSHPTAKALVGLGLTILQGGPVGAIGNYAFGKAVEATLVATGVDKDVAKLVTTVGNHALSVFSSDSFAAEQEASGYDGGRSANLIVGAGATILGIGALAGLGISALGRASSAARGGLGSISVPANLKYGTTLFGQEAHLQAGALLQARLESQGVTGVINRTGPGLRGVDMSVDPRFVKQLGFEHIEIKPNTPSGLRSFNTQVGKWGYDPATVRAVTYDALGNLRWGFDF